MLATKSETRPFFLKYVSDEDRNYSILLESIKVKQVFLRSLSMEMKVPPMSKVSSDNFSNLNTDIKREVLASPVIYAKIKGYFDSKYLPASKEYSEIYKIPVRSSLTKKISLAKDERIKKFRLFRKIVKFKLEKSNTTISDAADKVNILLEGYEDIASLSLNAQTGLIDDLLLEIDGNYKKYIDILLVEDEVEDIRKANVDFKAVFDERVDEEKKKPKTTLKDARKKLEPMVKTVLNMINAFAITEGGEEYQDFIDKMNVILKRYGVTSSGNSSSDKTPTPPAEPTEPETPVEPEEPVEETHEERMAKARPWTEVSVGEWKNGDYCWHMVNSVKTYWKLLDETNKTVKPYLSGGEAFWEKLQ
jgi:hypothetical protein